MLSLCAGGLTRLQGTHSGDLLLRHSTSNLKYHSHFWEADSRAASAEISAFHTAPNLISASKEPADGPSLCQSNAVRLLTCFLFTMVLTLYKHQVKSHLPSAGIIRSSPYSPR